MSAPWTREAVAALGPTTNVRTAASIIGVGERLAYESVQRGDWPTRVLRLGSRILIPTHDLIVLLYAPDTSEAWPATGPAANVPSKDNADDPTVPPVAPPVRALRFGP